MTALPPDLSPAYAPHRSSPPNLLLDRYGRRRILAALPSRPPAAMEGRRDISTTALDGLKFLPGVWRRMPCSCFDRLSTNDVGLDFLELFRSPCALRLRSGHGDRRALSGFSDRLLEDGGWFMARAAGTGPALRVHLEAPDAGRLAALEAFVRMMLEPGAPRPPR